MWVVTLGFLILAFYSIKHGYTGSLPWLTAMSGLPWAAYGVSQVYYYKKSLAENTRNGSWGNGVVEAIRKEIKE